MITVEGNTTLVGVTELRKDTAEILENLRSSRVILTKRNKPVGVILDYEEFSSRSNEITLRFTS